MARTAILPTDPAAVKLWSAKVAIDAKKKSFWSKMTGGEDAALPVVTKTELESGASDEITTTLIAKLRGKPIEGDEKGAGREKKLSHYTHKFRIDKHRQLVNCGDIMAQKRVRHNIAAQCRARLSDYIAEVQDEQIEMTAAGSRGVGTDEFSHYEVGYAGFPNAFTAPDAAHLLVGEGQTKATLTTKLTTNTLDIALVRAKKMFAVEGGRGARMEPISVDGQKSFVLKTGPEGMYDLRREVGEAGWLTLEKAKATAVGAKSQIFMGGDAFYNGLLITEHETVVKFDDYGAGGNTPAMRSLFLGAHAVAEAYGIRGQKGNVRLELSESDLDHGEEQVVVMRLIAGWSKSKFNGMDFGVQAVDHAFTAIA
ncbi:MAG: N4-gp56 family major capsid protein [Ramlibacter sp.]|nr:N4-gp56 family major capsid protein [Ramlibacter sp.]